jgi:hypothetical protein
MAFRVLNEKRLAQIHTDGRVAADTEIPIRSIGQLQNLAVHCIENRAQLRISML